MTDFSTSAIILRRRDFGDNDLILSLFTLKKGRISVIAKSAKKSVKRFSGVLELFSVIQAICREGKGIPILTEATLIHPFFNIRSDIRKTAYASYWVEIIDTGTEESNDQETLYHLLCYVLKYLDSGQIPQEILSILFQIRFLYISGLNPDFTGCIKCRKSLSDINSNLLYL